MSSLEEKVELLSAQLEETRKELSRLKDYNAIQLLMGKYMAQHVRVHDPSVPSQATHINFYANRPDTTAEIADHGVYVGYDHVKEMYEKIFGSGPEKGVMFEHNLATPMIVVADDGMTARGVWHCPGHETDPRMGEVFTTDAKPVGTWVWGRIAADFIKENGEWKIWHYHWYRLFRTPYDKCWTEYEIPKDMQGGADKMPGFDGPKRDRPTTYHNPYSLDTVQMPIPPCPEPYATWTDDRPPV